ncbi:polysaccharide pyruvyl transferase family protein [Allomuricauda sp. F6463D]|uniref:polysaccharide pyruvyl transferase family protein n=1 Tax=Allomuricauda sp. F6463D TaxID=2926409 RepID=UPI001FF5886B|nr:polysaccharide pyruvyl transferase family protein [Muricauda sp. F6463D]MCK0161194.1 polysaccharide pyruvyl transferase family protein [Muricauda sp. F6463D]
MKIGILTFHDGINFGAFLQAYSTKQKLELLGHQVEIINYKDTWFAFKELAYAFRMNGKFVKNAKKIWKFRSAHKLMDMTKPNSDLASFEDKYDVVFFGSDEIWNINNLGFGYDLSYFGKGLRNTKKIAYAPSFGSTKSDDEKLSLVKEYLLDFDAISVRDNNSQKIAEKLTGTKPTIVPDPTFLVDQLNWAVEPEIEEEYILVYAYVLKPEHIKAMKQFSKEKKIKLVSVGFYYSWCDENYLGISPFEWIGFFKKAKYVFTSMFHGTIYSILTRRNFTTFMDPYRLQKFSYLLDTLDIHDRIFDGNSRFESIDYSMLEKKIADYSNIGHKFIETALQNIQEP